LAPHFPDQIRSHKLHSKNEASFNRSSRSTASLRSSRPKEIDSENFKQPLDTTTNSLLIFDEGQTANRNGIQPASVYHRQVKGPSPPRQLEPLEPLERLERALSLCERSGEMARTNGTDRGMAEP
jgi:hypothetical protein